MAQVQAGRLRGRQPGDRRDRQGLPDDHRRRAAGRRSPGPTRRTASGRASTTVAGARRARAPGRRAARRAPRGARRDHRARDGQADRAGARRGRLLRRHLRVLRRQRADADGRRADQAAGRRGLGDHPPQLLGRAARDHAVELPLLPGGALRRPEPGDRQHDPAQARAAVPRVGRGDRSRSIDDAGFPRGRLRQHLRHQRADRVR